MICYGRITHLVDLIEPLKVIVWHFGHTKIIISLRWQLSIKNLLLRLKLIYCVLTATNVYLVWSFGLYLSLIGPMGLYNDSVICFKKSCCSFIQQQCCVLIKRLTSRVLVRTCTRAARVTVDGGFWRIVLDGLWPYNNF